MHCPSWRTDLVMAQGKGSGGSKRPLSTNCKGKGSKNKGRRKDCIFIMLVFLF
jgi:hypothetical protein